jgi:hypothetical protein
MARAQRRPARTSESTDIPDERADELYGLPLEEFVPARNRLAKELEQDGSREAAQQVKRLEKPTLTAWAVNQVARTQPKDAQELFAAGEELRAAHERALEGPRGRERLTRASARERAAVEKLVSAAGGLLTGRGKGLSDDILDRVSQTLHATAADEATRALAADGRLSHEEEAVGLGSSTAFASGSATSPKAPDAAARRREQRIRKALREAEERRKGLQRDLTAARRARAEAGRVLARAKREEEATARRLASKEHQLDSLKDDLRAIE